MSKSKGVAEGANTEAPRVARLCHFSEAYRTQEVSIREALERIDPDLKNPDFVELVRGGLAREPHLVRAWQGYSEDKRASPSPYLLGSTVGLFGELAADVVRHFDSLIEACAVFVLCETAWVLEGRRIL